MMKKMIYAKSNNGYIRNINTETKKVKLWKTRKQAEKDANEHHSIKDFDIKQTGI